jgi:CDGSH-type Zn-finger protein
MSDDDRRPAIKPRHDGPFRVDELDNLLDAEGDRIATDNRGKGNIALCRCGRSRTKPFCDGNHRDTGFRSARLTDGELDERKDFAGDEVTVHDNRGICAHIGYCTDQLPEVFKMGEEPWIEPEGAPAVRVAEQTRRCPSGALSHSIDGEEYRDEDREPTIKVSAAGPYLVTGGVDLLETEWLEGASREHYALCRCGRSENKPFCDGTHWYVEFDDPGLDTTGS